MDKPEIVLLRRRKVESRIGKGRSGIYNLLKNDPTFPKPIRIGKTRSVAWLQHEIDDWIGAQVRISRGMA